MKLFSNGGMHCTGTKTLSNAKEVCDEICTTINQLFSKHSGPIENNNKIIQPLQVEDAAIQMINTNTHIGYPIDLEKAFELFKSGKEYIVSLNRENHSALNIKVKTETMSKKVTVLIFTSGSIILIGGNVPNDIQCAYASIITLIDQNLEAIKYEGVYKSKKKIPGEPPKKRGRKRKIDSAEFYDGLVL